MVYTKVVWHINIMDNFRREIHYAAGASAETGLAVFITGL
jgi:hypothetical protein